MELNDWLAYNWGFKGLEAVRWDSVFCVTAKRTEGECVCRFGGE